jgi:hypothetical protein
MTGELRRCEAPSPSRRASAKEPDTFDGSDARKLNNFILLCNLYFRNNPSYSDDENKVTFALSYLRGMALEYFEPAIPTKYPDGWTIGLPVRGVRGTRETKGRSPDTAFIRLLCTQFGPIDPTADAEDGIDNSKMQETSTSPNTTLSSTD